VGDDADVAMNAGASTSRTRAVSRAHHRLGEWCSLLGVLCVTPALTGCPGTLSSELAAEASGAGAAATGTGGNGASGGTGGATPCTGSNDGATLIMTTCASGYCHNPANDFTCGGLDLTVDTTIGARLVGVYPTGTDGSNCGGSSKPYLEPAVTPAAGLLIDKITLPQGPALCGYAMPFGAAMLSSAQQACVEQWAEGLVMAAAQ
jgi:hypothetical protein